MASKVAQVLNRTVVISALGYFVDIYDLILFGIVRVSSLADLGVPEERLLDEGVFLLNAQMAGMLLGGIVWGVLGDKRGRVKVLFGSIALYSLATLANAFVTNLSTYAGLRFLAGIGLAGELGAAVTLVSEVMTKETRGYGTAIVAAVGITGAIAAAIVGEWFDWRAAYVVGGVLGLALLVARFTLRDSTMYRALEGRRAPRGDLGLLLRDPRRVVKYLHCILIGLPLWFVIGVLVTFSPELARELNVLDPIKASLAIAWAYAGLTVGDLGSGFLSQWIRSRRWTVIAFLGGTAVLHFVYLLSQGLSAASFYGLCFLLGVAAGYWAVFVTIGAEQFGTNLRATVATTVPNFIRGSVVPITLSVRFLKDAEFLGGRIGLVRSAMLVGALCLLIALNSIRHLDETYGKDLDYLEAPIPPTPGGAAAPA